MGEDNWLGFFCVCVVVWSLFFGCLRNDWSFSVLNSDWLFFRMVCSGVFLMVITDCLVGCFFVVANDSPFFSSEQGLVVFQ